MRTALALLLLALPAAADSFADTLRRLAHQNPEVRRKACASIGERGW